MLNVKVHYRYPWGDTSLIFVFLFLLLHSLKLIQLPDAREHGHVRENTRTGEPLGHGEPPQMLFQVANGGQATV